MGYTKLMEQVYCTNCGELVDAKANFCWKCGAALHGGDAAVYRAEGRPLKHPTVPSPEATHPKDLAVEKMLNELVPRRHLAPNAILLFFINYVSITFLVFPLFAIGIYFEPMVAVALIMYIAILYFIAVLVYNHFYFAVEEEGFRIDYGIVNKRHVTIPFRQIQNVNITRSLIDRFLGIGRLEIESAGSTNFAKREIVGGTRSKAEGYLPGLSMKDAEHLHDLVLQKSMHEKRRHSNN